MITVEGMSMALGQMYNRYCLKTYSTINCYSKRHPCYHRSMYLQYELQQHVFSGSFCQKKMCAIVKGLRLSLFFAESVLPARRDFIFT